MSMPRKLRIQFPGAIYHVTVRGNERRDIFTDVRERRRFLEKLEEYAEKHDIRIFLYCLMKKHFHLLLQTPRGNLSRFMAPLLTSYSLFFNLRHGRPRSGSALKYQIAS